MGVPHDRLNKRFVHGHPSCILHILWGIIIVIEISTPCIKVAVAVCIIEGHASDETLRHPVLAAEAHHPPSCVRLRRYR